MADENKNDSASETLSKGINAAQTISGAIKTGKAVAGMAKGAAAGPYGAIAAGIWENRSKIAPILFAVTAVFLLPVIFVLMLPSIIFGGFDADSPEPDIPVMNDNAAIMSNLHEAETAISSLLQSSHDKVIADINAAVAALADGELYEIIDPYANEIMFNSDLFISQYCASKNNYEEINITNLKNTITKGKDYLFSYKVETISVEVPAETEEDEEESEEPTVITVTKYTYTVEYAGDSYFADNIFNLTDEQKELAENYAYNLYVFLNDAYIDQSNSVHDSLTDLGGTYVC